MTTLRRLGGCVVLMAALASAIAGQSGPDDKEFQAALQREMVAGDLKGAIEGYRRVADRPGIARSLAAEALLRMGDCYQKLGNAQAGEIYARIVREFGDQPDVAQRAARHLGSPVSTTKAAAAGRPSSWVPPSTVSIHGKVSPDGRWLPYIDDEAREGFIGAFMLRDLISGTTRRIETFPQVPVERAEYAEISAFSRDGGQLAYAWRVRERGVYQLRVVPIRGNAAPSPRVLFDNPEVSWLAPYDWTPDGRSIAVVLQRKDRTAAIGLVSTATGAFQQLRSVEWDSVSNVALSADGGFVAFDRRQPDGTRDVFVLTVDGSRESAVVSWKADDSLVGWSPDGGRLLFLSDRSGSVDLWAVSIAAGRLTGEVQHLRSNVGRFWPAGVTRDGAVMAAVISAGGSQLKIAGIDVEPGRPDTAPRVLDEFVGPGAPMSWSQNGRRLASVSQYAGMRPLTPLFGDLMSRLSVHTIDTNDRVVLPRAMQYVNNLDWAADDQALVVAGADLQGRTGIFRVDIATGVNTAIVLTPGEQPTMPVRWRALLGERLYYQRNVIATQTARLVEHDVATGVEREILPWAPRFDGGPPDPRPVRTIIGLTRARQILYVLRGRLAGESILRVLSLESGDDRELMRVPAPETLTVLDLLPDHGTALVVRKNAAGQSDAWLVPLQGPRPSARIATLNEDLRTYRVLGAADANGVYLAKRESTAGVLQIWRLSTEGTLIMVGTLQEQGQPLGQFARISPDRNRLAFVTQYQPPAAPLELVVLENLLQTPVTPR